METILVVDDEKNYLLVLSAVLEEEGYEVLTAPGGLEALEIQKSSDLDLVLTDMKMPGMDGIELLERIKAYDPDLPVIMMTAHGTVDKAVEAMQKGAYSYVLKPFDNERLILYVKKAVAGFQVVKENRRLRHAVESQYRFGNIIGKSKPMRDVFETIQKVAPVQRHHPDRGRERNGQGAGRQGDSLQQPAAGQPVRGGQLLRPGGKPARKRALRPRKGGLHRRDMPARRAASSWPMAGHCSWTRSASFPPISRSNCCGCCRKKCSSASAASARSPWTFA